MAASTRIKFDQLDRLREELGVSIDECAALADVSALTYKRWRKGVVPSSPTEEGIEAALSALRYCRQLKLLPVEADTMSEAKLKRLQVLDHIARTKT